MKRLQLRIDEDLDEALAIEAARLKTSKASLIRQYIRNALHADDSMSDPMAALIGDIDGEIGDVDMAVYGS